MEKKQMETTIEKLFKRSMTRSRWEFTADALVKVLEPRITEQLGVKYICWGDYHWRGYYAKMPNRYVAHVDYMAQFFAGKTGRLLDIGCGDCLVMKRIEEESNLECFGIDSSPLAIEYAYQHRVTNCKLISLEKFNDGKFDYILFADVLEHLKDPYAALQKARKLMTNDGTVFCSFPVFQPELQPGDYRLFTTISAKKLIEEFFIIDLIDISKKLFRMYVSARKIEFAEKTGG